MHVVTTPLFLTRLLWVCKPHRRTRRPKLSCWRPPLTFTHERLMCLTSIMMTTYLVAMALCCSPTLFPPFLAQARYHRLHWVKETPSSTLSQSLLGAILTSFGTHKPSKPSSDFTRIPLCPFIPISPC